MSPTLKVWLLIATFTPIARASPSIFFFCSALGLLASSHFFLWWTYVKWAAAALGLADPISKHRDGLWCFVAPSNKRRLGRQQPDKNLPNFLRMGIASISLPHSTPIHIRLSYLPLACTEYNLLGTFFTLLLYRSV